MSTVPTIKRSTTVGSSSLPAKTSTKKSSPAAQIAIQAHGVTIAAVSKHTTCYRVPDSFRVEDIDVDDLVEQLEMLPSASFSERSVYATPNVPLPPPPAPVLPGSGPVSANVAYDSPKPNWDNLRMKPRESVVESAYPAVIDPWANLRSATVVPAASVVAPTKEPVPLIYGTIEGGVTAFNRDAAVKHLQTAKRAFEIGRGVATVSVVANGQTTVTSVKALALDAALTAGLDPHAITSTVYEDSRGCVHAHAIRLPQPVAAKKA